MARYKHGDIVVLPFPFSDASSAKPRPCLVAADLPYLGGMDYLVCMISSAEDTSDPQSIELQPSDLVTGRLYRAELSSVSVSLRSGRRHYCSAHWNPKPNRSQPGNKDFSQRC